MEHGHQFASGEEDELFRYEGAEKTLEVHFSGLGDSLRTLPRQVWDTILDHACCRILSKTSRGNVDAYVLSESSLFVYDWRLYLKTCGRTTLLKCLPPLIEAAEKTIGASADWMRFSHKNFVFPQDQKFPHVSFEQETQFCLSSCPTSLSSAHVLGDLLSDHWNVLYVEFRPTSLVVRSPSPSSTTSYDSSTMNADPSLSMNHSSRSTMIPVGDASALESCHRRGENIVNIMMYGMHRSVAAHFYPREGESTAKAGNRATGESGIEHLFTHALSSPDLVVLDHYMFTPCGYSLNALIRGEFYATIHVTPEEDFSYASFETNLPIGSYEALLQRVLDVFRPQRCTVALFSDCKQDDCLHLSKQGQKNVVTYRRTSHGSARIQNMFYAEMSTFSQCGFPPTGLEGREF